MDMAAGLLALPRSLSYSRPLLLKFFSSSRPCSSVLQLAFSGSLDLRSCKLQYKQGGGAAEFGRQEEQSGVPAASSWSGRGDRVKCWSTVAERSTTEQEEQSSVRGSERENNENPTSLEAVYSSQNSAREQKLGAFQHLPMVSPSHEILGSALRRAKMVRATKGIPNAAKRERNRGAKQLDALIKELTLPLRTYLQKFPQRRHLHAYERALLELTLGDGTYEEVLGRVDFLRKKVLDLGKNYASLCAKSTTKAEAEERLEEGFSRLEDLFNRHGNAVDDLKEYTKILRAMPVVQIRTPTLCLVGAPNVGKSSLVRILSSGKPEVCNYPFTTRGISMGHFEIESRRFQVTDTPGLLKRPDEERNNIERLTLAALSHLPTSVLFVHDLTGECGTSVPDQFDLFKEMKGRFPDRPWLDVVSKADLLPAAPTGSTSSSDSDDVNSYAHSGPCGALWVSVETGQGVDELVQKVHSLLLEAHPVDREIEETFATRQDLDDGLYKKEDDFYQPAWPRKQQN